MVNYDPYVILLFIAYYTIGLHKIHIKPVTVTYPKVQVLYHRSHEEYLTMEMYNDELFVKYYFIVFILVTEVLCLL